MDMKTALTIAGTDPSGGAGIQADIKTMTANGVFATCAVTALVAQNTTGVKDIVECTPEFLAEELDCVFTDIFPDAVKTGMVSSIPLIETIAAKLKEYGAKNLVVDPVMVATSGDRLISEDAVSALKELLLPLATVLTPNIPEAEILSQLYKCQTGDFSDDELEWARRSVVSTLRTTLDNQSRLEDYWLGQGAAGLTEGPDELAERVEAVTRAQVVEAAQDLTLDTVYFLKGRE